MPEVVVPLTVRDLAVADLPACRWAGSAAQFDEVMNRVGLGAADYLAVCPPSGLPIALGGVIWTEIPGAGTLWQLSVFGELRSCGIGTILIGALEQRIRERGLSRAELGVEDENPRARLLYERLGYVAYGREPDSWDVPAADGSASRHETMVTLMRKELRPALR